MLKGPREALPTPAMRTPASDVTTFELDDAGVGEVEAGDDVDERGLAGPVRSDETDDLVAAQLQGHVAKGVHPLEGT